MVKKGTYFVNSRMNNTVNSQHDEILRKLLHKMLNSERGSRGKIILLLLVYQPLTTEEICTKVGFKSNRHFKDVLSKELVKDGLIKQLNDKRWVLWYYEPLDSKQKYGASDIMRWIGILENEKMPQDSRVLAGQKLVKCCYLDSEIVDGKDILRPFFKGKLDIFESIDFVSDKGIVFTQILIALKWYVAFQLQGEEDIQWMKKTCYPKLLYLFNKSGSIEGRHHILRILSEIYRTNELDMEQRESTMLLRKQFFDPKEDEGIASRCWDILLRWANDELKETLKNDAFNVAKAVDTFWSRADDELKEILKDTFSKMTPDEKEILKNRGVKVMKRHYGF